MNLSLNMPGDCGAAIFGRFSAKRQVNLTELSFSSVSESPEVKSVMRIGMIASKSLSYIAASGPYGIRTEGEVSICSTCKHSSVVRAALSTSYSFEVVTS